MAETLESIVSKSRQLPLKSMRFTAGVLGCTTSKSRQLHLKLNCATPRLEEAERLAEMPESIVSKPRQLPSMSMTVTAEIA